MAVVGVGQRRSAQRIVARDCVCRDKIVLGYEGIVESIRVAGIRGRGQWQVACCLIRNLKIRRARYNVGFNNVTPSWC